MKIEICEQMVQSWLQHHQLCEIVQTNWMISPKRLDLITSDDICEVQELMKEAQERLNEMLEEELKAELQDAIDEDADTFEKNGKNSSRKSKIKKLNIFRKSTPLQFLRQCEIDVAGIKLDEGITDRIFLIDTAFHKTGVGYADPVARILKKLIRAVIVATIIFGKAVPVTVAFAAPACGVTLETTLESVVNMLRSIIGPKYPDINIELYLNERFAEEIYLPLKKDMSVLNNDNDLFMRAMILTAISEDKLPEGTDASTAPTVAAAPTPATARRPRGYNEKRVFAILQGVIKSGKMTPAVLNDLQISVYARKHFKLSTFPVLLKEIEFPFSGWTRVRFYGRTLEIAGESYLVCSQMSSSSIDKFEAWAKAL